MPLENYWERENLDLREWEKQMVLAIER